MAMNIEQLESEIIAAMELCGWNTSTQYSKVECLANAIATAVITHIQNNAVTSVDGESIL